jgi:sigma-B regulation protein RsbU (phosphoserine phosphatase)
LTADLPADAAELFDRAPCGLVVVAPDRSVVRANATFCELSGYRLDELTGRTIFDVLSVGARIYWETHVSPMLRMGGSASELALDLVCRDGSRLPVLVNVVLDRDDAGRAAQVRMAVFAATHRREYERELLREKERAETSEARALALARTLQQTLIPPSPPTIPGLEVAARYRPAGDGAEVGGDFYDVFQVDRRDWVLTVGDVCGKGVQAAVVTALARHTLRAAAMASAEPVAALTALNDALLVHGSGRFCSVALARMSPGGAGWQVRLSTAGHPLPLHRRADGVVTYAGVLGGRILGIGSQLHLRAVTVDLAPGDALLFYTDGVPEAQGSGQFYGDDRLRKLVEQPHESADALVSAVLDDVLCYQDGRARDDTALLAVRVPVS